MHVCANVRSKRCVGKQHKAEDESIAYQAWIKGAHIHTNTQE